MASTTSLRALLAAPTDGRSATVLADVDPASTPEASEKKAEIAMAKDATRLLDLSDRLRAEGRRSVLLVLQGMDASGKDGSIKHVIGSLNPVGVSITSFKAPSDEEKRHHFLWRIRKALPRPGTVGVFNRSHYEDVGIVKVHGWVDAPTIERRYGEINAFEANAAAAGITLVKCFLHISFDEQRRRLVDRLDNPAKIWKFNLGDLDERDRWIAYQEAYSAAIVRCSPLPAPWHVVPADNKWYRNWALARLLIEILEDLDPQYPKADFDVVAARRRLTSHR